MEGWGSIKQLKRNLSGNRREDSLTSKKFAIYYIEKMCCIMQITKLYLSYLILPIVKISLTLGTAVNRQMKLLTTTNVYFIALIVNAVILLLDLKFYCKKLFGLLWSSPFCLVPT